MRPNAISLQSKSGTFSELFASGDNDKLLILFEMRRYTKLSFQLARATTEAGIPLVIICDTHCYWAHGFTENVPAVNTESELFWDSHPPFATLSNLLLDDVIAQLVGQVAERIQNAPRLISAEINPRRFENCEANRLLIHECGGSFSFHLSC